MGLYTTVYHPDDGRELQIRAGNDFCDCYHVGDEVSFVIHKDCAGSGGLFDGIYESDSSIGIDDWVVIKDHKVVAVENKDRSYADLYKQYDIKEPEKSLWTEDAWRRDWEIKKQIDADYAEFAKTLEGSKEEKFAKILTYPIRRNIDYPGLARKIFNVE